MLEVSQLARSYGEFVAVDRAGLQQPQRVRDRATARGRRWGVADASRIGLSPGLGQTPPRASHSDAAACCDQNR